MQRLLFGSPSEFIAHRRRNINSPINVAKASSSLKRLPRRRALPATHIKILEMLPSFTPEKPFVGLVKQENGLGNPLKDAGAVGLAVDAENYEIVLILGQK